MCHTCCQAFELIEKAEHENALVVYTLVDNAVVKALRTAAQLHNVVTVDLWGPLLDSMESHLETMRRWGAIRHTWVGGTRCRLAGGHVGTMGSMRVYYSINGAPRCRPGSVEMWTSVLEKGVLKDTSDGR